MICLPSHGVRLIPCAWDMWGHGGVKKSGAMARSRKAHVLFLSTKIAAAVRQLFDGMPQKPSDQAIEQFSSTMAEIIRDAGVEGGGTGNVVELLHFCCTTPTTPRT